ncbi:MAG: ABC transporter substrate-binding protein [Chloroflexi bacterium]|nr:ABC transporter substrate-binding protein [Chloroflexota bacterium]
MRQNSFSGRRLIGLVRCGVAALLLLSVSAGAVPLAAAQTPPSTLTFTRLSDLTPIWHPVHQTDGNQHIIYSLIYSNLVKVAADERTILPDLADMWEVSPDATEFTFHLHPGVEWSDGVPFTAKDIAFTIAQADQFGAKVYKGYAIPNWLLVKGGADVINTKNTPSGIEVIDDNTIRITLDKPNAEWLRNLPDAIYSIMPEHILKDATPQNIESLPFSTTTPVGTGPYKFVKYLADQYVQLEANPAYFKGAPQIQQMFFKLMKPEVAVAQVESGDLDLVIDANVSEKPRVDQIGGVKGVLVPGVGTEYLQFRVDNPTVADNRVRQAIYYAVDRRAMLNSVFNGAGQVLWVPAGFDPNTPGLNQYPYDPEMATQLLNAANFDFSAPFRVIYSVTEPGWQEIAATTQAYLQAIGINAELQPLDGAGWESRLSVATPDWELSLQCCGAEGLSADRTSGYFNCQNPTGTFYANCDMDAMFAQARQLGDPAARQGLYAQLASILNTDVPYLWLWKNSNFHVATTRLGGSFELYPNSRESFYQAYKWTLQPK